MGGSQISDMISLHGSDLVLTVVDSKNHFYLFDTDH